MAPALDGINVLDLSEYVSGAYCCKLLGAFGAEVIKVESPRGDRARREGVFPNSRPDPEASPLFSYLNTNKLGVTLDLQDDRGRAILRDLVLDADVLVENFGPALLSGLGLSPALLHGWNPRLITLSISYFGDKGPYVRYKGTPLVAYALGGYLYITGEPDREPLQSAGPQPEYLAGLHGAIAALTALHAREDSGLGLHAEVPIFEMMTTLHQYNFVRYHHEGLVQGRLGNRYSSGHPITIYRSRDGHVAISTPLEDQAERLLQMMGMPALLEDDRFATGLNRLANADAFDALVEPWLMARDKQDILKLCQDWRVPCGLVSTIEDLLQDPQLAARQFWVEVEHPSAGFVSFPGAPFKMSETPWTGGRAPLLGEHNRVVYAQRLGYSAEKLALLRQQGVI